MFMRARSYISMVLLSILFAGCATLPSFKGMSFFNSGKKDISTTAPIAAAASTEKAVDRMEEINKRHEEEKKVLNAQYEKFRQDLTSAYKEREKVDNDNFDKISQINYGIFLSTEPVTNLDTRVLIANMKAKENMSRLMPLNETQKMQVKQEIEEDRIKTEAQIRAKYESKIKEGEAAAAAYEKADQLVKQKEEEKTKLRNEQAEILAKLKADQEAERQKLKQEAVDAVAAAKEQQKAEMIGWLVKILGIIGVIVLLVGLLLKSPIFMISGAVFLGLAYIAATVAMWIILSVMGACILGMVLLNPKSGKPTFVSNAPAPVPAPVPPAPQQYQAYPTPQYPSYPPFPAQQPMQYPPNWQPQVPTNQTPLPPQSNQS